MCGEQLPLDAGAACKSGSPPRVRGTVTLVSHGLAASGITPACAGNSSLMGRRTPAARDHPRVCGEQLTPSGLLSSRLGSPPRVRGTEERRVKPDKEARITPACAGNSGSLDALLHGTTDHPRVCGEQDDQRISCVEARGSPPRVRGTVAAPLNFRLVDGITPACAGNRRRSYFMTGLPPDHPRVCGEQSSRP